MTSSKQMTRHLFMNIWLTSSVSVLQGVPK